jgi:hypothetical protein
MLCTISPGFQLQVTAQYSSLIMVLVILLFPVPSIAL